MLPWPSSQRNGRNHNFQQVELKVPFLLVASLVFLPVVQVRRWSTGPLHVTFIGVTRDTELTQDMALSERPGQNTLPLTVSVF